MDATPADRENCLLAGSIKSCVNDCLLIFGRGLVQSMTIRFLDLVILLIYYYYNRNIMNITVHYIKKFKKTNKFKTYVLEAN